jgi:chromosome partitioning protein
VAKKIAIAIKKGGVGKTVTSKNAAAAVQMKGKRVLLVDVDEQANATKGLGYDPATLHGTLNDLFANADLDPRSVIIKTELGIDLLPGHAQLKSTETGMALQRSDPSQPDPIYALKGIIDAIEGDYDFIFFDTPPSIGYMTINALAAADEVLIPAAAAAYTYDGIASILGEYERARKSYNPGLTLRGILITRVKRTNAAKIAWGDITRDYGKSILPRAIVETTVIDEAEQLNQPVVVYAPDNIAAAAYQELAEALING